MEAVSSEWLGCADWLCALLEGNAVTKSNEAMDAIGMKEVRMFFAPAKSV
jgi:hypothetical protein